MAIIDHGTLIVSCRYTVSKATSSGTSATECHGVDVGRAVGV